MITAREAGLVACRACARVWPADQTVCGRCGSRLQSRDRKSLQRVWAWWLAGLICYIPANLTPMLETRTLISREDNTIISGAVEIARHGDMAIAIIVLVIIGEVISESYETEIETLGAWMEDPGSRSVIMDSSATSMGFAWFQETNGKIWWSLVMGRG